MQREMRGGAHKSTPLARRSTERRDLRSDNANREFEDETKECDELRAAFSVSKTERGRTSAFEGHTMSHARVCDKMTFSARLEPHRYTWWRSRRNAVQRYEQILHLNACTD